MKKWMKVTLTVIGIAVIVVIMIFVEVTMRAKEDFITAEVYKVLTDSLQAGTKLVKEKKYEAEIRRVIEAGIPGLKVKKIGFEPENEIVRIKTSNPAVSVTIDGDIDDYDMAALWYGTAIRMYAPKSKWVNKSGERLFELARMYEEKQDYKKAKETYEEVMHAIYAIRSFYIPHENWLNAAKKKAEECKMKIK